MRVAQCNDDAQKARMARVRIAKATSGAAFVSKKKACEARLAAQEAGEEVEPYDDIFELQHHHLLRCLEKATDREFVELDLVEAQLNQQASAENQAQALSLSKKLLSAAKGTKSTTRGCLHSCCPFKGRGRGQYSRRLKSGGGSGGGGNGGGGAGGIEPDEEENQRGGLGVELKDIMETTPADRQQVQQTAGQGYRVAPTSLRQRLPTNQQQQQQPQKRKSLASLAREATRGGSGQAPPASSSSSSSDQQMIGGAQLSAPIQPAQQQQQQSQLPLQSQLQSQKQSDESQLKEAHEQQHHQAGPSTSKDATS